MDDNSIQELSQEELSELIRSGRIKRHQSKRARRSSDTKVRKSIPQQKFVPKTSVAKPKEPDPDWLQNQVRQAERNLSATEQDKRRRAERLDAAKF